MRETEIGKCKLQELLNHINGQSIVETGRPGEIRAALDEFKMPQDDPRRSLLAQPIGAEVLICSCSDAMIGIVNDNLGKFRALIVPIDQLLKTA